MSKRAIIIAGPTAVGKTSVAIEVARHFNTEIISADSRQCYSEMNIGVARPDQEELAEIKHHFIASHSVKDNVNAGVFEDYALEKANELFKNHDTIVMVGGTGLYINAFSSGMDRIPEVPAEIREQIISNYEAKGLRWLQEEMKGMDPVYYESGEIHNPQRLMRALEVKLATGNSIVHYQKGNKAKRDFEIIKFGLELPKEELHRNINGRVDKMIEKGLVEEVKSLLPYRNLNALQTVGYSEIFEYLDGKISLSQAIELIKQHTRQYAKRQMTWFKKDKEIHWLHPANAMNEITSK